MATGIEIAGLILAALPLFISAAEHYKEGIGFVKKAVQKELFAAQYKEELTQQKTLLVLYIQGVVGKTQLPPQTQRTLVGDPSGEAWKRPDVLKEVAGELGDAYQSFVDVLSRICRALTRQIRNETNKSSTSGDIARELQELCLEHNLPNASVGDKTKLFDRIKFSWRSSERAGILAELQACNKMLEKLSVAADRAKPYVRKQQSQRVHTIYEQRQVAQRLFDVLRGACNCEPAETHSVGLRLEIRREAKDTDAESTFQMILFHSQGMICELSARLEKVETTKPSKKKVRIFAPGSGSLTSTSNSRRNMKILEDICKEVSRAHACQSCLQLVVDKHEKVYCASQQSAPRATSQPPAQQVLSLAEMLSSLQLYDRKRWVYREKSILAIILAYSLLRVHDSSWSQSNWSSHNIAFLNDGHLQTPCANAGIHLQFRRPYARSQVAGSAVGAHAAKPQTQRKNAHLHALGVILLELHLNRSIHDDVLASKSKDYRVVAQDLLEEEAADDIAMTPEYLKAVRFCLIPHPNRYSGSYSFEDRGFREIYYEEVIAMLEENLTRRFEVDESVWLTSD